MQDTYVSQALIRIVPQQIPDSLVQNASSQQLVDHINGMAESILSRNTLSNLINTYHLYKSELKSEPLEDVINKMKGAIHINPTAGVANISGRNVPAMQIAFAYRDRSLARAVCDDLVGRFMSQNTQDTLESHEQTSQFMNDEFQRAKREMDALDQKLADFRTRNAGRLPEQMELNLQQLNGFSNAAGNLNEQANRNKEQRMMIESAIRIAKDRLNCNQGRYPAIASPERACYGIGPANSELAAANCRNGEALHRQTSPICKPARSQVTVLQHERDLAAKEKPPKMDTTENPAITRERIDAQGQIDGLMSQLKANDMEAAQIQKNLASVNAQSMAYQAKLQGVPAGEKEYAELMNDREIARQHYNDLEMKRDRSSISMDMERRKQGETLEVLDAASLPAAPTAPKRAMIIPMGPVIGFILGFILVAIREVKDTSLKNLKDARLYTQLSILGSVPLLENDLVVQRRKQMMWVGWATATLVGLAIMGVSVAHYYLSKA